MAHARGDLKADAHEPPPLEVRQRTVSLGRFMYAAAYRDCLSRVLLSTGVH